MNKELNKFEIEAKLTSITVLEKVGYAKVQIPAMSKEGKKINKFISIPFFDDLKELLKNFAEGQFVRITGEVVGSYKKTYVAAKSIELLEDK